MRDGGLKSSKIVGKRGLNGAKDEENPFFIFRPPFFIEKRKIEKKRKQKILRFIATLD